jgi:hypothetical protein
MTNRTKKSLLVVMLCLSLASFNLVTSSTVIGCPDQTHHRQLSCYGLLVRDLVRSFGTGAFGKPHTLPRT